MSGPPVSGDTARILAALSRIEGQLTARVETLSTRIEALDLAHQRDLLAIERRLGAIEDAGRSGAN